MILLHKSWPFDLLRFTKALIDDISQLFPLNSISCQRWQRLTVYCYLSRMSLVRGGGERICLSLLGDWWGWSWCSSFFLIFSMKLDANDQVDKGTTTTNAIPWSRDTRAFAKIFPFVVIKLRMFFVVVEEQHNSPTFISIKKSEFFFLSRPAVFGYPIWVCQPPSTWWWMLARYLFLPRLAERK